MAQKDPNIKTSNVMKKVLKNLIDRNKDKGRDNEYWSMQLLIKLGMMPDPLEELDNFEDEKDFKVAMTVEERARKLKEVGVFLPKEQLAQINNELEHAAVQNMKTMKNINKVEADIKAKFTKQEIKELRKLGLKNEDLLKMDINKAKPFKD